MFHVFRKFIKEGYSSRWWWVDNLHNVNAAKLRAMRIVQTEEGTISRVVVLNLDLQTMRIIASYEDPDEYDTNGIRRTNG